MTQQAQTGDYPVIAGQVLPLQRAEELIATLPSVVSVRIVPTESGGVDAIHILVTGETPPKQMVRNVESALMAHLGLRVDHRKVSVATTTARPTPAGGLTIASVQQAAAMPASAAGSASSADAEGPAPRRVVVFEDIEIRGSRSKGVAAKVTLRRGDEVFVGEAEGHESDRSRMDVAANAALEALVKSDDGERRRPCLEGTKLVQAFDREFVFVGVSLRLGRESALVTGTAEVKDSKETACVLAVLDATNRWVAGRAS